MLEQVEQRTLLLPYQIKSKKQLYRSFTALSQLKKMGKRKDRLFLSVGLVLYLFDLGSDIYVAVQYWKNDETWWFGLTVGLICVPSLIVNLTAIFQFFKIWTFIAAFLQLSIVIRYAQAFASPKRYVYLVAKLRYLETITESAPQWCLQVYIMLRQWSFPSYTVVSSVFSLLSLAWSITTLEKQRLAEKNRRWKLFHEYVFFNWQLSTLISRLFAISLFAYVFRYYVIIFLAVHWLIQVVAVLSIEISADGWGKSILLSLSTACPALFHSAETVPRIWDIKHPKRVMGVGYAFLILTTIIMVMLSLAIKMPDVPHMNLIQPIAIASVAGVLPLSLCFYLLFRSQRINPELQYSSYKYF